MTKQLFDRDFEITITTSLDEAADIMSLSRLVAEKLKVHPRELPPLEIKRRSIDARRGRVSQVFIVGLVDGERETRIFQQVVKKVQGEPVIIVGAGPAGLFCAYELMEQGIASIICERGKMVQARRKDLKGLNQHGVVDEDSNYCFGEGGAGTYSDGKLYTRSHKRGNVRRILEVLVAHGANPNILTEARPHIGSNKLPNVVTALRNTLERAGVEFLFDARVVDIFVDKGRACGVTLADGREIRGRAVVVATGHSARDMHDVMGKAGALLEAKPFAMGVRIEHPQALISQIQYGKSFGHEKLPAAYYRLAYTPSDGRGAFSFCMCPGGWIVPASTSPAALVVNGMSLSKRDSAFANSGLVVSVSVEDVQRLGLPTPYGGVMLQQRLEEAAFEAGGGGLVAPAVRATDFVRGRISSDLPKTSYLPGLHAADLNDVFRASQLPLAQRIKEAIIHFDRIMPGYLTEEAVLVGVESRTSSPVRMLRDKDSFCSNIAGLYPCGEGAGFAGGIVSAAIDGINVAGALANS